MKRPGRPLAPLVLKRRKENDESSQNPSTVRSRRRYETASAEELAQLRAKNATYNNIRYHISKLKKTEQYQNSSADERARLEAETRATVIQRRAQSIQSNPSPSNQSKQCQPTENNLPPATEGNTSADSSSDWEDCSEPGSLDIPLENHHHENREKVHFDTQRKARLNTEKKGNKMRTKHKKGLSTLKTIYLFGADVRIEFDYLKGRNPN